MAKETNSLFPALVVRSIVLGSLVGSILINDVLCSVCWPWDEVTIHSSPLIVSLKRFTASSAVFCPRCSKETMVHSPWSLASSCFAPGAGAAAACSPATLNHDSRSSYQFWTTPFSGVAPSLRNDQLP